VAKSEEEEEGREGADEQHQDRPQHEARDEREARLEARLDLVCRAPRAVLDGRESAAR